MTESMPMFKTSESTAKLDVALAKAQGKIEAAIKSSVNPFFRSKYADLATIWDACRAALSQEEIAVSQWPAHSNDGMVHLITRVSHAGEWMLSEASVPIHPTVAKDGTVRPPDAQGYGSAITYLRRYGLGAAVGVVTENDDDGNASAGRPPQARHDAQRSDQSKAAPNQPRPGEAAVALYPILTRDQAAGDPQATAIRNRMVAMFTATASDKDRRAALEQLCRTVADKFTPPLPPGPWSNPERLDLMERYISEVEKEWNQPA